MVRWWRLGKWWGLVDRLVCIAGKRACPPEEGHAPLPGWPRPPSRITLVQAQRVGSAGRTLEIKIRNGEEGTMTTLIERARKWGEELNQQWREKGIERGRREGVERGRLEGIELGIPHGGVERGRLEGERSLVDRLVT